MSSIVHEYFIPNEGQQIAIDGILNFIDSFVGSCYTNLDEFKEILLSIGPLINPPVFDGAGLFQMDGPGGTGKTFVISRVIEKYMARKQEKYMEPKPEKYPVILAPTHKAVSLLRKCSAFRSSVVQIKTAHSFFSGVHDYDEEGNQIWSFTIGASQLNTAFIVIDEASMINAQMYSILMILSKYVPIITAGDRCQLPPVKDTVPNASYSMFYERHPLDITLSHIERTKNRALLRLLKWIRRVIISKTIPPIETILGRLSPYVVVQRVDPNHSSYNGNFLSPRHCHKRILESKIIQMINDESCDDSSMVLEKRFLAHRTSNKQNTVGYISKLYRATRFGTDVSEYLPGELLVATDIIPLPKISLGEETNFYIHTSSYLKAINVDENAIQYLYNPFHSCTSRCKCEPMFIINTYLMEVVCEEEYPNEIFTICRVKQQDQPIFLKWCTKYVRQIKEHACYLDSRQEISDLWRTYYSLRKKIHAPIEYGYATSIHKSQGSTIDFVCVYVSDFKWMLTCQNPELRLQFFHLLYVAMSRAQTTCQLI